MKLLYTYTQNLPTQQGGGHHRHIGLIMKSTIYKNLMTTAWKNLPDPGTYPTIYTNNTADLKQSPQIQHDEGKIIHKNTGNTTTVHLKSKSQKKRADQLVLAN